jgi:hypothetical protein
LWSPKLNTSAPSRIVGAAELRYSKHISPAMAVNLGAPD